VDGFARAVRALADAKSVAAFTGAGVSAESGVPTFRGADGLWEGHSIEEVATPEAFHRDPVLVWRFYEERRKRMGSVEPNAGHAALPRLEKLLGEVPVITQNIDGLHASAGSTRVIELHGSLWRARCAAGCGRVEDPFPYPSPQVPPLCDCGGMLRPEVVWFREALPEDAVRDALAAAEACEVMLVIGTSGVVWPAAGIPGLAREAGAFTIEINPTRSELTAEMDVSLRGPSAVLLPELVEAVTRARGDAGPKSP
jgi:NAD-dependent deacetylase